MQPRKVHLLAISFCLCLLSPWQAPKQYPPAEPHLPLPLSGGRQAPRRAHGPYRVNNDLLHYNLHVPVDPAKQFLSGMNAIQFRMLEDGSRIQRTSRQRFVLMESHWLTIAAPAPLTYQRRTIYVDFPHTLRKGKIYTVGIPLLGLSSWRWDGWRLSVSQRLRWTGRW